MRDLTTLDRFRFEMPDITVREMTGGYGVEEVDERRNGFFAFSRDGVVLRVVAASGAGWDHVSVSLVNRCPTWEEMEFIARLFFNDDEVAMQLHVPAADHINRHPFTLHWWRPISKLRKIPLPPKRLV
jgi:hypothetical protein